MDLSLGGAAGGSGASGDEQENRSSRKGKRPYHRHTPTQTAKLETFFKELPHPDENQRREMATELGLEPQQIKFWFQNKRTQIKNQNERADNSALRAENQRMQNENNIIREALKNIICRSCGGPPFDEEERQLYLQKLQQENQQLKEEHEKVSNLLSSYMEMPRLSQPEFQLNLTQGENLCDLSLGISLNQPIECASLGQGFASATSCNNVILALPPSGIGDKEKALMSRTAATATEELLRLLRTNKPLWVESSSVNGKLVLNNESYENLFPRANPLKSSNPRVESSKDSRIVSIKGSQLVELLLDSEKWVNLFSTIVTKAQTIEVLESGLSENRSGALQLMYEEMHVLSPFVPNREFFFLRYCQQIEDCVWVIADVSFDCVNDKTLHSSPWKLPSGLWRLPSGCMIHELPNGSSKVTWVEHVIVDDDKYQTHQLYRDLVCSGIAYGAERWLTELQRMCERFAIEKTPSHGAEGVINSPEGKRGLMKLSQRMVKNFCGILNFSGKLDVPHVAGVNNDEVRISAHKNTEPGRPNGMIVSAATSFWLPVPRQNIFDFFRDEKNRVQWDVLSNENAVDEIERISSGTHPGNYVSIIRPNNPTKKSVMILQECFTTPSGSCVVHAPINLSGLNVAIRGEDCSRVPILPSGIIICGDGRRPNNVVPDEASSSSSENVRRSVGSLLTIAFQLMVFSPATDKQQLDMESVDAINTLITSTVQRVKDALNCSR